MALDNEWGMNENRYKWCQREAPSPSTRTQTWNCYTMRLGGSHNQSWRCRGKKNLSPIGNRTPSVQSLFSRYYQCIYFWMIDEINGSFGEKIIGRGNPSTLIKLPNYHIVDHKSHMTWYWMEPASPRWVGDNWPHCQHRSCAEPPSGDVMSNSRICCGCRPYRRLGRCFVGLRDFLHTRRFTVRDILYRVGGTCWG
jgi:hypothetical protein